MKTEVGLLALLLAAGLGCQSLGPTAGGAGCRAVGELAWTRGGDRVEATAVVHLAASGGFGLRAVDPLGRPLFDLRTEGERVRLLRPDDAIYWEGEGTEAIRVLTGLDVSPADWVKLLVGRGEPPSGWQAGHGGDEGCLPASSWVEGAAGDGRKIRVELNWSSVETWDGSGRMPPVPDGYRRVPAPPLEESGQ